MGIRALGAGVLLWTGCANMPHTAPDTNPGALRGIDFQSEIAILESFPVQLAGTVQITNRRETAVSLTFPDDCVALLRIYDREGARNAPVWDQRGSPACEPKPLTVALAPGGTAAVRVPTVSAYEILSDNLPDGSYRVTVYLQPNGNVIEAEAGSVDLAIPREGGR
ncbi:MAG TPA: hypothetical protein VM737_03880 [Gemmatimonadota bacterium]|nr:hypothetical protein [Gemmatimonadota bacterium]